MVGLQSAIEAMKDLCENIVLQNPAANHQTINMNTCPNQCSFKGACFNGTCVCEKGFTSEDCSLTAGAFVLFLNMFRYLLLGVANT